MRVQRRCGCHRPGKHPRIVDWQNKATTDAGEIRKWWSRPSWSNSNIGVLTGTESNLAVIDIDGQEGLASFQRLCERYGWSPSTYCVRTGRGVHVYLRMPARELRNSAGKLGVRLDVRAEGGYVVGEGSTHATGTTYLCAEGSPDSIEEFPLFLSQLPFDSAHSSGLELACAHYAVASALAGPPIPEGTRNDLLYRLACSLRGRGARQEEIEGALQRTNRLRCSPMLCPSEVHVIAVNAAKFEPNRRRSTPLAWKKDFFVSRSQDYRWKALTDYQRGWSRELEDYAYIHYGLLPADPKQLLDLALVHPRRRSAFRKEYRDVLYDYVEVELAGGATMLFSERFASLREDVDIQSAVNSASGKASAAARQLSRSFIPVEAAA